MIRRLVHQQHVGTAEQRARHGHAHLPAARERSHVAVDPRVVESQAVQHFARLALERIAAQMLVLRLHLAEPLEQRVHVAGTRGIGQRVLELFEIVVELAHAAAARDRFVEHRPAGHFLDVLPEVPTVRRFGTETSPTSGDSSPVIRRKSVVLPEPFGPTRPTFSPAFSWNEASTKSTCLPYCLLTLVSAITTRDCT